MHYGLFVSKYTVLWFSGAWHNEPRERIISVTMKWFILCV